MEMDQEKIDQIIDSGILEEYCLGLLTEGLESEWKEKIEREPKLVKAVQSIQGRKQPEKSLKFKQIWENIKAGTENATLFTRNEHTRPEVLGPGMDINELMNQVQPFKVPNNGENINLIPFRQFLGFHQFIASVKKEIPLEVHDDMIESFILLKGECRCLLGQTYIDLKPGDFLEIPIHTEHSVKVTSKEPVLAVLQRVMIY